MLSKLMSEKKRKNKGKSSTYTITHLLLSSFHVSIIDPSSSHVFKWFVDTYRLI